MRLVLMAEEGRVLIEVLHILRSEALVGDIYPFLLAGDLTKVD